MKPFAKILGCLMFTIAVAVGAVAGELPQFEFLGTAPGKDEKASLVFEVKETSVGRGDNLHTIYVVKAVVIRSDLKELKEGSEFEGYFDRWYSIFDAPSEHPLKIGGRVEVGVVTIDEGRIEGFLKRIEAAEK